MDTPSGDNQYGAAAIIAIVEGLTEFLPVSSTGHMILVEPLVNFTAKGAHSYEIFIQLGAVLAVLFLYPHRFLNLLNFTGSPTDKEGRGFSGFNGLLTLAVGCLPAFILGFLFHDVIKEWLFNPISVALALILGGVVLIGVDRREQAPRVTDLSSLTLRDAFWIGIAQCFSLWPGVSRSGSTIVGGLLRGIDRPVCAEFSFLLAVPVMIVASAYDLLKSYDQLSTESIPLFCMGFIIAGIVGALAIKGFVGVLNKIGLEPFGWYRIALGVVVLLVGYSL